MATFIPVISETIMKWARVRVHMSTHPAERSDLMNEIRTWCYDSERPGAWSYLLCADYSKKNYSLDCYFSDHRTGFDFKMRWG